MECTESIQERTRSRSRGKAIGEEVPFDVLKRNLEEQVGPIVRVEGSIPIENYFREAESFRIRAKAYISSNKLESAYVNLMQYANMVLHSLPAHPSFDLDMYKAARRRARKYLTQVIPILEELNKQLRHQFNSVSVKTTTTTQKGSTTLSRCEHCHLSFTPERYSVVLWCFHTFCITCVQTKTVYDTLVCLDPNCCVETELSEELTPSPFVTSVHDRNLSSVCEMCQQKDPVSTCVDCSGFRLCKGCEMLHRRAPVSQNHRMGPIHGSASSSMYPLLCPKHKLEMRYVCEEDGDLLCSDCHAFDHAGTGHHCKSVGDAFTQEMEDMNQLVQDANKEAKLLRGAEEQAQQALFQLRNTEERLQRDINAFFDVLLQRVQQRHMSLLEELESTCAVRRRRIEERRRTWSAAKVSLESMCHTMDSTMKSGNAARALQTSRTFHSYFDSIAQYPTTSKVMGTAASFSFVCDDALLERLDRIGSFSS